MEDGMRAIVFLGTIYSWCEHYKVLDKYMVPLLENIATWEIILAVFSRCQSIIWDARTKVIQKDNEEASVCVGDRNMNCVKASIGRSVRKSLWQGQA